MSNNLDDFITATAVALDLTIEDAWKPAVKTHLDVTLRHAAVVVELKLPEEVEPAPVFKA
jgi:hypothetical protein